MITRHAMPSQTVPSQTVPSQTPSRNGPERTSPGRTRCATLLARALLLGSVLLSVPACGGGAGDGNSVPGTVAVINQTDLGMAPLDVEQFFLQPVDGSGPVPVNLLRQVLQPGGVEIVGLFPAGLYNATAVLEGGSNVNWMNEEIRPGEPKNFVVP